MNKLRLIFAALALVALATLYACGQSKPSDQDKDQPGVEETEQSDEEKTREMIEEAEKMEGDTSTGSSGG